MSDPIIKIESMNKWFDDFQVLKDINLSVEKNKKIVVAKDLFETVIKECNIENYKIIKEILGIH